MNAFTLLASLLLAAPALAQGTPVPKYGQCPTHTSTQGGSCVPNPGYTVWWNNDQQCPVGVTKSKGYCVRSDR
jgi:hypothetical protein